MRWSFNVQGFKESGVFRFVDIGGIVVEHQNFNFSYLRMIWMFARKIIFSDT
jgi:hypothetical protein